MPGRVEASRVAASRKSEPLTRTESMKLIFAAADKAMKPRNPKTADLDLKTSDLFTGKGGVKAVVVNFDEAADGKKVGRDRLPTRTVLIDEAKKQMYVGHWSGHIGPVPLPAGVTLRALLDTPAPRARTDYQKTIGALAEKVLDGLPTALRKDHTQFAFKSGNFVSPSGEKMKHAYIDDHTGHIPGGALMVGKKEFWVELIPGVSGNCIGPFELPKGFTLKSLDRAQPRGTGRTIADDGGYGRRGTTGYDSSRGFPDSLGRIGTGGSSSGVLPMRGSVWGGGSSSGGGGGSWGGGGGGGGGS
jgi:hypothetical protein